MDKITQNLKEDYDPTEKIKDFSVDMISYYYLFSRFSFCEDKSWENNKYCHTELLNNWERLSHKEYKISIIERIIKSFFGYKLGNIFDKIKAFLDNFSRYIYNFIILKRKNIKNLFLDFLGLLALNNF